MPIVEGLELPLRPLLAQPTVHPDHHLIPHLAARLAIPAGRIIGYRILRRSLDARGRSPKLLYRVAVQVQGEAAPPAADPDYPIPLSVLPQRPRQVVVVGAGPAGLFATDLLTRHGVEVCLLDRGREVDQRSRDLAAFLASRQLDPESNYLYGEGGAGTYSDGKLHTGVRDPRLDWVLRRLVAHRAPRRILYDAHPHIGSDVLPQVVRRLRQELTARGATVRWGSRVEDVLVHEGRCCGVRLAGGGNVAADAVLLAVGHSARDLLLRLAGRLACSGKPFQLGVRIEHRQDLIDRRLIGCRLPAALGGAMRYAFAAGGCSTFCMCPGGEVMAASADPAGLCTNGMSRFRRAGPWANAALIGTLPALDPAAAFQLLAQCEQSAFQAGGSDWTAPAQSAAAFLRGETGPVTASSYPFGLRPGRLDRLLPAEVRDLVCHGLRDFDRRLPGFVATGQLIGLESRVSSPLRFHRDPRTLASSLPGLYLAGEGAGWAGGISSAALDGLRCAEALLAQPQ